MVSQANHPSTPPLRIGDLLLAPTVHGKVAFAREIRRRMFADQPAMVAVELPGALGPQILEGVRRLPLLTAVCFRESDSQEARLCYVPIDPCDATIEAIRLAEENGLPVAFIDRDVVDFQETYVPLPCDYVCDQAGYEAYCQTVWPSLGGLAVSEADQLRNQHMARRLRSLTAEYGKVLWVGGFSHWPQVVEWFATDPDGVQPAAQPPTPARDDATLAVLDPEGLDRFLVEIPHVAYLYECARQSERLDGPDGFPPLEAVRSIFLQAEQQYTMRHKEKVNLTQWRALMQYTRNLALMEDRYRPSLYGVVMAARGCVDGDYGYETWEAARDYPYQEPPADLPVLQVYGDRARLGDHRYRSKPRWPSPKSEMRTIRFRRRPRRRKERELWKALWQLSPHSGICSWPPEDDYQERFMTHVRKRALRLISEDRSRLEEFTTSFLDGLDVRETLRNWHTGKLFVREQPRPMGQIGSVALLFEDEPVTPEQGWRETLYAEHSNESDIAFFGDALGKHVIGPGICYTHFNGLLSVYPACHIHNPWLDPALSGFATCGQVLLAAAILYSEMRYVAYVAASPPPPLLRELAADQRRHIIYMPLQMFSKNILKRIRRFHILEGRHVRSYASDFIEL